MTKNWELELRAKIDNFLLTHSLHDLAEAYLIIKKIFKEEQFPISDYTEWQKQTRKIKL